MFRGAAISRALIATLVLPRTKRLIALKCILKCRRFAPAAKRVNCTRESPQRASRWAFGFTLAGSARRPRWALWPTSELLPNPPGSHSRKSGLAATTKATGIRTREGGGRKRTAGRRPRNGPDCRAGLCEKSSHHARFVPGPSWERFRRPFASCCPCSGLPPLPTEGPRTRRPGALTGAWGLASHPARKTSHFAIQTERPNDSPPAATRRSLALQRRIHGAQRRSPIRCHDKRNSVNTTQALETSSE